jgi:methyltransferase
MSTIQWVILLVALQRLGELWLSARNSRWQIARGGQEVGRAHYPLIVMVHAGWLISMLITIPASATLNVPLIVIFLILQVGRIWVIASLGRYWSTRIISNPSAPLIRHGPYRWIRHPNYLIVSLEIAVLPLAFGAWKIALVFSLANAAVLWWRIRVENATLVGRTQES